MRRFDGENRTEEHKRSNIIILQSQSHNEFSSEVTRKTENKDPSFLSVSERGVATFLATIHSAKRAKELEKGQTLGKQTD